MKRLAWFTGLAWAVTFAQTTYATHLPAGSLSVTGDIHASAPASDTASSNPFTIVNQTTLNSESSAPAASSASSASSQTTSSAIPKASSRHTATTATATTASSQPTGTTPQASTGADTGAPALLSSISPVLNTLVPNSGNPSSTSLSRHRGYAPAPANNPDPGTPAGLQPFNPTPAGPGTGSPASVPDGGTTSALLGIGLVGTAMMKKKFAK